MKISRLLCVSALCFTLCASTGFAQSKKSSSSRKKNTTTAVKKSGTTTASTPKANTFSVDGESYVGLMFSGKPNQPDMWVGMDFENGNFDFDMGGQLDIHGTYKFVDNNTKLDITAVTGKHFGDLTSTDNGKTLKGTMVISYKGELYRLPDEEKEYTGTKEELAKLLKSGYNCFFVIKTGNGNMATKFKVVFTDDTYKFVFDNPQLQKVFPDTPGKWSYEDGVITLTDFQDKEIEGDVYDDGKLIEFELGSMSISGFGRCDIEIYLIK